MARGRLKRPGPVIRVVEWVVLGAGMTIVAWVIERRMVKALKKQGMKDEELAVSPEQVEDEPGG